MQELCARQDFASVSRRDLSFSAQNRHKLYYYFYFQYSCNNRVQDRIFRRFQGGTFSFQRRIGTNCIIIFIFNIYAIIVWKKGFFVIFKEIPFLFIIKKKKILFLFFFLIFFQ